MTKLVHRNRSGMTLVEILITVSIIGLLAAFIIPAYNMAMRHRENALLASQLRQAVSVFSMYRMETGLVPATPPDGTVPPVMADYFSSLGMTSWWTKATPVGGVWGWVGGIAPAVTIVNPTRTTEQMQEIINTFEKAGDPNFRKVGTTYKYYIK